jgi:CDGSH-type Zn-finger protein
LYCVNEDRFQYPNAPAEPRLPMTASSDATSPQPAIAGQPEASATEASPAAARQALDAVLVVAAGIASDIEGDRRQRSAGGREPSGTDDADGGGLRLAAERIRNSVIRPLGEALAHMHGEAVAGPDGEAVTRQDDAPAGTRQDDAPAGTRQDDVPAGTRQDAGAEYGERLWRLARDVTRLRMRPGMPVQLQEAASALQDLCCLHPPDGDPGRVAACLAGFREIQAGLPPMISASINGPYLVTNVPKVANWLGEPVQARPQMALCRCGASAIKPYCDGSHARIGFSSAKDPKRVPDQRDTYVGQQVTVLDNRGVCQHSGYCTDRLPTVFHTGAEPFVTPSGGRMDEIIRAVRDCPSGDLSYAIDGREAREQTDYAGEREPAIEVSKDGPYRITGGIALGDGDATRGAGASQEHYALCRCGQSLNKPFCSGMHWTSGFRDPVPEAGHEPTLFEWCGGLPALTRMTRLFYEKYVPQDPLLGPLFATMSADHPQRVAAWLGEVFCGPKDYSERYGGYPRMVSQHLGKGLTEEKRARWVALLLQSAREAGLPNDPEFRSAFGAYIEWGSRLAVENSQAGAKPPEHMPMPRWDWHTAAGPPGSRISALAPPAEAPEVVLPVPGEPVSFENHIKPLFRERDRQSMRFAFDLWSYDDVREHADAIYERLRNGSMPCDGAWAQDRLDAFGRWIESGLPG